MASPPTSPSRSEPVAPSAAELPPPRPLRALGLILIAGACFASLTAAIKAVGSHTGLAVPIFARGVCGVLVCWFMLRARGQSLRPRGWKLLALRCGAGAVAMLCYYWSVLPGGGATDLATAAMLLKTAPLWVALLAPWVVGERPQRMIWLALAVGLLGVGLRYGFAVQGEEAGVAASLVAGVLAAFAYLALRGLAKTDDSLTVVTVFSLFLTVAPLPFAVPRLLDAGAWPARVWWLLLACGALGTVGQLALTSAYRWGSAAAVTVSGLSEVAMAAGFSIVAFGEPLTAPAVVGGALALGAGLIASVRYPAGSGARSSCPDSPARTPPEADLRSPESPGT